MPYRILWIIVTAVLSLSTVSAQNGPRLVVAWVEMGDLWVWQADDTHPSKLVTGDVITPYIAPDGKHIAFTRGTKGNAESLWLVANSTTEAVNLTPNLVLVQGVQPVLSQIGWRDGQVIYFNTALPDQLGLTKQDDLWQVNIVTHELSQIFPPGQGGDFTFSPDHKHLALVYPGTYGDEAGSISLITVPDYRRAAILNFPAVSTASSYKFYPRVFWNQVTDLNNRAGAIFMVAIPGKDLIYNDATELTTLWQLNVDGEQTQVATLQTSFFGQPQWSHDLSSLFYITRYDEAQPNNLTLIRADGDGSNPLIEITGKVGILGNAQWIPDSLRLVFEYELPGKYYYDRAPVGEFPESMFSPRFLKHGWYVFAAALTDSFELRYARIGDSNSTLIATVTNPTPVLDAVLVP